MKTYKRVWRGLTKHKTDFSYRLPPCISSSTSYPRPSGHSGRASRGPCRAQNPRFGRRKTKNRALPGPQWRDLKYWLLAANKPAPATRGVIEVQLGAAATQLLAVCLQGQLGDGARSRIPQHLPSLKTSLSQAGGQCQETRYVFRYIANGNYSRFIRTVRGANSA